MIEPHSDCQALAAAGPNNYDDTGKPAGRRLLLIGAFSTYGSVGGLSLALQSVVDQLGMRGWQIELLGNDGGPAGHGSDGQSAAIRPAFARSWLHRFQRWWLCHWLWGLLPLALRYQISTYLLPRTMLANAAHNLTLVDDALRQPDRYDLVLLCVDGIAPGAAALALERHPRVVLLSLEALAIQLAQWPGQGWMAHWRLGKTTHPYLYARVPVERVRCAIFPSRGWQEAAIAAGLPATVTHVIYFGIPTPPPAPRPEDSVGRLLWVGRLAPEKGLHLFLNVLPALRRAIPSVRLTVVAAPGPEPYRGLIERLVAKHDLADRVSFHGPVPRAALQSFYAEHDLLLFYSKYPEPVALVMMEAMAAGLPVVAPRSRGDAQFVQDGQTCLCYDPRRPPTLVDAVIRLHSDATLRRTVAGQAQHLIRSAYSLEAMGDQFDRLFTAYVEQAETPARKS
jgi:glycosyltransferase involved in cell wall biosynthesis